MTDRIRPTASRRQLLKHCQHWATPSAVWSETGSALATAGTEAHAAFEAIGSDRDHDAPEHARRKAEAALPVIRELRARGVQSWTEIAFAWNPTTDTARVLGVGEGREVYAKATDDEMTGTADLVVQEGDGHLLVVDYKSDVPGNEVDATAQLRTLALFAARALRSEHVETMTVLYSESDARRVLGDTLETMALDAEAEELYEELGNINETPKPGPWCSGLYCPAIASCPATVDALAQTLPPEMLVRQHRLSPVIASPEHAAWTLTALDLVDEATTKIRAYLRAYADANGGISLADGTVWQGSEVTTEKPALDVPGALAEVKAAGAEAALDITTSWSAIERAIGKAPAKELRKALSAMGATKTSTHKRYEAKKARKKAA